MEHGTDLECDKLRGCNGTAEYRYRFYTMSVVVESCRLAFDTPELRKSFVDHVKDELERVRDGKTTNLVLMVPPENDSRVYLRLPASL